MDETAEVRVPPAQWHVELLPPLVVVAIAEDSPDEAVELRTGERTFAAAATASAESFHEREKVGVCRRAVDLYVQF